MKRCLICGTPFKSGPGLASHRRAKHPKFRGENRLAAEEMIAALEREQKLEDRDVARLQIIRSLADQLDSDPTNAQMWKTYNDAIADLRGPDEPNGDAFEALLAEINSRAPVGNPPEA